MKAERIGKEVRPASQSFFNEIIGLAAFITHLLRWLGLTVQLPDAVSSLHSSIFLPLGKDIILLFIGGFVLSAAMTKHGLDRLIASHILRPFTR